MDYASTLLQLLPSARRLPGLRELINSVESLPATPSRSSACVRPPNSAPRRTRARSASRVSPTSRIRSRPRRSSRICTGSRHHHRGHPARRHRRHADLQGRARRQVRRARRRDRRRRHQARPDPVQVARRGAGGIVPQDGAGDGARPARDPGEARRSHPQHAHAGRHGAGAAPRRGTRDARHLRADRRTPRPLQPQARARGPRLQGRLSRIATACWSARSRRRAATRSSSSPRSPTP